ncbi:CDC73-domain-containing protein [Microthyrium microscopicum]|uniref:CDC73-domain-containing protein n=1 Tax=Microthyrium microscopicum TaxID=703497 RepID=A0A6A6U0F7_9PEZI|nr:CDC73-domain-containing protein [Microthyrium microscopicum]
MSQTDVLVALRQTIESDGALTLSTSSEPTSDTSTSLANASHLQLKNNNDQTLIYPLTTATRFLLNDNPVDLRSVFFAWQNKDASVPDYINSIQKLNEQLSSSGASSGQILNLPFAERLDLNSWLSGQQDESEYVVALDDTATGDALTANGGAAGAKRAKEVDLRLQEIYRGERQISDRNSILHGIKPTDFSHVRKQVQAMFGKNKTKPMNDPMASQSLSVNLKKSNQRPNPIILLSPSASSLLRLTNIKKFLEDGIYVPADSELATHTGTNRVHITRQMDSIDTNRRLTFALMESTEQFRPEYWTRVVAVFTTGQEWQFKTYKWATAPELFSRVLGIYVGIIGDSTPQNISKWGRTIKKVDIEKWNPGAGERGRWRDRESVENIWRSVEESMRSKSWAKENGYK